MFARNAPLMQWAEWKKSYNPDIDVLTDPENMSFAITGFAPNNIFDQGDWNKMSLDRGQIAALAEEAPAELKRMFQPLPTASPIESVSFEYRSVGIVRPWFESAVFRARFWRMDDSPPLSDGATPPRGRCPNYITAMVFARNIMVTSRAAPGASKERPQLVFISDKMVAKIQPGSIKPAVVTGKAGPATVAKSAPPAKTKAAQKELNATAMARLSRASFPSISRLAPAARLQAAAALAPQAAAAATAVRVARPDGVQVRPSAPVVRDHRARPAPARPAPRPAKPVIVRPPPAGRPAPRRPPGTAASAAQAHAPAPAASAGDHGRDHARDDFGAGTDLPAAAALSKSGSRVRLGRRLRARKSFICHDFSHLCHNCAGSRGLVLEPGPGGFARGQFMLEGRPCRQSLWSTTTATS